MSADHKSNRCPARGGSRAAGAVEIPDGEGRAALRALDWTSSDAPSWFPHGRAPRWLIKTNPATHAIRPWPARRIRQRPRSMSWRESSCASSTRSSSSGCPGVTTSICGSRSRRPPLELAAAPGRSIGLSPPAHSWVGELAAVAASGRLRSMHGSRLPAPNHDPRSLPFRGPSLPTPAARRLRSLPAPTAASTPDAAPSRKDSNASSGCSPLQAHPTHEASRGVAMSQRTDWADEIVLAVGAGLAVVLAGGYLLGALPVAVWSLASGDPRIPGFTGSDRPHVERAPWPPCTQRRRAGTRAGVDRRPVGRDCRRAVDDGAADARGSLARARGRGAVASEPSLVGHAQGLRAPS